jgi:hypothetical protein
MSPLLITLYVVIEDQFENTEKSIKNKINIAYGTTTELE